MAPDPLLVWIARAALALVFGAAALHKWRDFERFADALRGHHLVPATWVAPLARAMRALETALVPALLLPATAPVAAGTGAALLVAYSAAIAVNLARGRRDIDCGCSLRPRPLSGGLLARNGLLGLGAALAAAPPTPRALAPLDLFTAVACLATALLLWGAAGALAALPSREPARRST